MLIAAIDWFTCKLEDYFCTKQPIALDHFANLLKHHILNELLYFQMHAVWFLLKSEKKRYENIDWLMHLFFQFILIEHVVLPIQMIYHIELNRFWNI